MYKALPLALLLASCSVAPTNQSTNTKTVIYDEGGFIDARNHEIQQLKRDNTKVEIKGVCISACTMYLSLENTCVHPDASLGFHGATELPFIPATPKNKLKYDLRMAKHYPPNLRKWFMEEGRKIIILWKTKSGQEVHDMDPSYIKLCKD